MQKWRAAGARPPPFLAKATFSGSFYRFGGAWSVMIVLQIAFAALCLSMGIAVAYSTLRNEPQVLPSH